MSRIAIVFGTRPEIIRLSRVIASLREFHEVILVNTRQNFDHNLSDIFLSNFGLSEIDYEFKLSQSDVSIRIQEILTQAQKVFQESNPDSVLILGDTYSGLSAITANDLDIPVYHMEAGNRCFSDEVPEEQNRITIDKNSRYLLPYTEGSRSNLLAEGFDANSIFVTGNPILEVISHHESRIENSPIVSQLGLTVGNYVVCTLHRAEGIDNPERLQNMLSALADFAKIASIPIIVSTHPRLRSKLDTMREIPESIKFINPLSFFDFVKLEKEAKLIATDSGTVQEEACIFGIPAVTLREVTERPETIECGSNVLTGYNKDSIVNSLCELMDSPPKSWIVPEEYLIKNVAERVNEFIVGTER